MTTGEKLKQKIWRFVYKFFPTWQKMLLKLHFIWHQNGRQRFHIGYLAPGKTLLDLKNHLHDKWGFGNHFVAWTDEGQVLSWRKLKDFNHQYHIRIFSDGEIRGHYEYTPEGHPLDHFDEKGEEFHRNEFFKFLGNFITDKKYPMHLKMDPNAFSPDSEISFEPARRN